MNTTCALLILIALVIGLALGRAPGAARVAALEASLAAERRAGGAESAATAGLVGVVAPLRDCLDRVEDRLHDLENARVGAYSALTEQVGMVRAASAALTAETAALANALRAPQTRGRWGELQLRRVVELAGMESRCDFEEQV
ncbi:MAG TPA: DNA recombination protein RmuC, partial [Pseudonocardiaceae bacterium]|nr:DNA recombination protein RmuC [Pseudonocardiaceae bacterium]